MRFSEIHHLSDDPHRALYFRIARIQRVFVIKRAINDLIRIKNLAQPKDARLRDLARCFERQPAITFLALVSIESNETLSRHRVANRLGQTFTDPLQISFVRKVEKGENKVVIRREWARQK